MDLTFRKDLTIDAYQLSYLSTKKYSPVFNFNLRRTDQPTSTFLPTRSSSMQNINMASTLLTSAEDIFRKDDNFAGYKNIIAEFPHGSREHPDGKEKVYLLKCAQFEDGCVLVQGEFNAMSEIYATAPGFVPKPYTWGTCHLDDTEAYFFISEFIDFSGKLPEPDRLCRKLVDLHQTSVSPTGKFGFHVTTCQGRTAQSITWEKLDRVLFRAVGACSGSRCGDEWPMEELRNTGAKMY
ncbi:Fructosamine kinase [Aspergillus parasiticus SU-1]|uniref:protein-ribulosamine 3-kinase n=1 Tax=Aspergillus parasiticus (strain ATCC 56775 / NRRL 5862 / SRRC 143 / SU-1) TaxID=1403190 RepID=A0A0F0IDY4_ASPPU|nr:Fructosamine kinase [Aspergillus parasiticus SU-1]